MAQIHEAIPKIMADLEPIAKNRNNPQQGYKFRGIDDVYECVQAVLAKHGVFTVPRVLEERSEERQTRSGSSLIYRVLKLEYTFYAADASFVQSVVIGEGMDSGDKASNKAMSVAHKYALLQVFCIPTTDPKDPENDHHEVGSKPDPRQPGKDQPPPAKEAPKEQPKAAPKPAEKKPEPVNLSNADPSGKTGLVKKVIARALNAKGLPEPKRQVLVAINADYAADMADMHAKTIVDAVKAILDGKDSDVLEKILNELQMDAAAARRGERPEDKIPF